MSIEYVRKTYAVPARRGGRVEYTGGGKPEMGTIKSASGGHLNIQLDGVKHTMPFHPTWELRYLDTNYPADTGMADNGGGRIVKPTKPKKPPTKSAKRSPWRFFNPGYLKDKDREGTHTALPSKLSRPI